MKKNSSNLAICLLFFFALACVCPHSENRQKQQFANFSNTAGNFSNTVGTKTEPFVAATPRPNKESVKPDGDAKNATIISSNANLRATPEMNGAVIETLTEQTIVRVIRHKGAWFYVETATQKGWLHGNTIQLSSTPEATPSYRKKPSQAGINNESPRSGNPSGATARCADGTYSYSAHHRGTCSHHGGVAIWLD